MDVAQHVGYYWTDSCRLICCQSWFWTRFVTIWIYVVWLWLSFCARCSSWPCIVLYDTFLIWARASVYLMESNNNNNNNNNNNSLIYSSGETLLRLFSFEEQLAKGRNCRWFLCLMNIETFVRERERERESCLKNQWTTYINTVSVCLFVCTSVFIFRDYVCRCHVTVGGCVNRTVDVNLC
jgi:hypothetical protein